MSVYGRAGALILQEPGRFSRLIIGMPLYPYQVRPLRVILDSVLNGQGQEYLLVFSRQSGKNEAVAHLLVYLLNLYRRRGGNIVYAATGDGIGRGIRRLEERLDNPWNRGRWRRLSRPTRRSLGKASVTFMSSHPSAAARGETADLLLVVDELQDQDAHHLEAVFTPMRASTNATAVYLGTVRTGHDALWQKKVELERLEAEDGVQRVFMVGPEQITAANPKYRRFLRNQIRRHGRDHPIVASEYFLEPLEGAGGLFPARRRALMVGEHGRQRLPDAGVTYVALIDVGGQDEAATDPVAVLANPARDYTACTIASVEPGPDGPLFRAVDVFTDQGSRHFEDYPGRPALARRLLAYVQQWRVAHVVVDATGVGEGLASWLARKLGTGRVTGFRFAPRSKAALGAGFLALVETGRFRYWGGDGDEPGSDGWWFWQQAEACTYDLPAGGRFDHDLRWGVPAGAKVSTAAGPRLIHDDRLVSAALAAEVERLIAEGVIALGRAESRVISGFDPLDDLSF